MTEQQFRRVDAVHPHWSGVLLLWTTDNAAAHEGHASRGTYELAGPQLTIFWHGYAPDIFVEKARSGHPRGARGGFRRTRPTGGEPVLQAQPFRIGPIRDQLPAVN
jgi:hypothetical protein